jgi:valyl-tRNA synthetase
MEEAFMSYRLNDAAQTAYEFFWNDFCDWYVEASKLSVKGENAADDTEKDRATTVLLDVLAESLKLLHPLLPFVTEEIYGKLPNVQGGSAELLITAQYPKYDEGRYCPGEEKNFAFLQELVRMVRTLRSECTIGPDKKLKVQACLAGEQEGILKANEKLVKLLAGIDSLEIEAMPVENASSGGEAQRPAGSIGLVGAGFEVFVFIAEAVDTAALKQKFSKDLERDRKYIEGLRQKLANEQFVKNAPPELVAGEREKLEESLKRTGKIEAYLNDL